MFTDHELNSNAFKVGGLDQMMTTMLSFHF